jgi:hypothetical protein
MYMEISLGLGVVVYSVIDDSRRNGCVIAHRARAVQPMYHAYLVAVMKDNKPTGDVIQCLGHQIHGVNLVMRMVPGMLDFLREKHGGEAFEAARYKTQALDTML